MTSKTSFIDFGIVKHNIKRYWWVSALMFAVSFIATILRIVLVDLEYHIDRVVKYPERFGEIILRDDIGIMILLPTASVLVAVCALRYLQLKRSATLLHSMPPKRCALFSSSFLSGIILFAAPVLTSAVLLSALCLLTPYGELFSIVHVLRWCGIFLLYGLSFYSISMLIGVLVGSSVAQFVFTYILLGLPFGFVAVLTALYDGWLFAFVAQTANPMFDKLLEISPFNYPVAVMQDTVEIWQYILIGAYIVLSYIIGLLFYKKRNIENSGDVAAFKFVRPVFLYSVAISAALAGAALIKGIMGSDSVSLTALILFSLLGYIIAKMLLVKSFNIAKYYKGAICIVLVICAFFLAVNFNIFGFGKTAPNLNDVEKAYLGTHLDSNWLYGEEPIHFGYGTQSSAFLEPENIKAVIDIQQKAIDNVYPQIKSDVFYDEDTPQDLHSEYGFFTVSYRLKSGKTKTYEYLVKRDDAKALFETSEAKDYMFPYLRNDDYSIAVLNVRCYNHNEGEESYFKLETAEEKAPMIEALKKDIAALSYEEIMNETDEPTVNIDLALNIKGEKNEGSAFIRMTKKFEHTFNYLKEYQPKFYDFADKKLSELTHARDLEKDIEFTKSYVID